MNKQDFKLTGIENLGYSFELIEFLAVNEKGKTIFGAKASISRHKDLITRQQEEWKINYGTSGSKDYKTVLPYVAVINQAMEELRKRSE